MTVAFVSAIYDIHPSRSKEIWGRLDELASIIPIVLVCSSSHAERVPKNVIPFFIEFETLETYKRMEPYKGLPSHRNMDKDTREYMILMNAKTEILQFVKDKVAADHYIWIDAGISKIFSDPNAIFNKILTGVSHPLKTDKILLPGCWHWPTVDAKQLTEKINWRFAGGFFIVPRDYVEPFYNAVLSGCVELGEATGKITWEVNTWCFIERHLPILWAQADHNDTIINGLSNYRTEEDDA